MYRKPSGWDKVQQRDLKLNGGATLSLYGLVFERLFGRVVTSGVNGEVKQRALPRVHGQQGWRGATLVCPVTAPACPAVRGGSETRWGLELEALVKLWKKNGGLQRRANRWGLLTDSKRKGATAVVAGSLASSGTVTQQHVSHRA